jgi:hypothetical protein
MVFPVNRACNAGLVAGTLHPCAPAGAGTNLTANKQAAPFDKIFSQNERWYLPP